MSFDLRSEKDVKEYVDNLGIEYRFGCYSEKKPERMQNLSISCALVSLILLVASALVGLFGVLQKQNSAVLITGFMYLMAAIFSIFSFSIIHFKRKTKRDCGVLDSQITHEFYSSRTFQPGWSLQMGWTGVTVCLTASLSWILLARFMRYTPGSSLLSY